MSVTLRDILRGVGAGLQTYGTMRYNRQMNELDAQQREQTLAQQMAHQRAMQEDSQAQQLAFLARQDELMRGREMEQRAFDYPEVPGAIDLSGLGGGKIPSMGRQIDGLPGYRMNRTLMDQMMMPKQEPQMYGDGWYTPSGPDQARLIRMRGDINGGGGNVGGGNTDRYVMYDPDGPEGPLPAMWMLPNELRAYVKDNKPTPDKPMTLSEEALTMRTLKDVVATKGEAKALIMQGKLSDALTEAAQDVATGTEMADAWRKVVNKYLNTQYNSGQRGLFSGNSGFLDALWKDADPSVKYKPANRARALAETD